MCRLLFTGRWEVLIEPALSLILMPVSGLKINSITWAMGSSAVRVFALEFYIWGIFEDLNMLFQSKHTDYWCWLFFFQITSALIKTWRESQHSTQFYLYSTFNIVDVLYSTAPLLPQRKTWQKQQKLSKINKRNNNKITWCTMHHLQRPDKSCLGYAQLNFQWVKVHLSRLENINRQFRAM